MRTLRVAVIGSGYVGLVTGACLAEFGHRVRCVDKNPHVVEALSAGKVPIYEPGLGELIARNVAAGRLDFSAAARAAIAASEIVFIAVGTPRQERGGDTDLSGVLEVAGEIAAAAAPQTVIVTKSTVPVGGGDKIEEVIARTLPRSDFSLVSNPEFLREGTAVSDFFNPDRVVVGSEDGHGYAIVRELYEPLLTRGVKFLETSRRAAEMIKYASNAFLATKIGFINEISDLCEQLGADVRDVALGIGLDQRIGPKFLEPGPGYGGSCFPKDVAAITHMARDAETPLLIVEAVAEANDTRKKAMAKRIINAMGGEVRGKTVGILGLTFKANTDDLRESPALAIVRHLQAAGAKVRAYDPKGGAKAKPLLPDVAIVANAVECAIGCDAIAIVTEWEEFRALDLIRIGKLMRERVLVDLRSAQGQDKAAEAGFRYIGIGLPERRKAKSQPLPVAEKAVAD